MGLAFWGYRFCGFLSSSIPLGTLFFMDLEVLGTRAPVEGSSTRPLGSDSGRSSLTSGVGPFGTENAITCRTLIQSASE